MSAPRTLRTDPRATIDIPTSSIREAARRWYPDSAAARTSGVGRAGCPVGLGRPVLGRDGDQVACRVLHVGIDARVAQLDGEPPLELGVRRRGVRMCAQVVAEEQRVPL